MTLLTHQQINGEDAKAVIILDGDGNQITSFGGGTQYSDGEAQATPTGTVAFGHDGTNVRALTTDSDGDLQVDVKTSALPTGASTAANQTTANTALAAIETAVEALQAGQLPDSHNVTVDNASIAVTGTFWQATQPVSATNLDIRDLAAASDSVTVHGDVGALDQFDLTNSHPAVVAIVDSNGDQITSFGGGTQYTEDAAAAANPVGTVPILIRKDTPASEVSADGDNVAQRGTTYGAAYVTLLDSSGAEVSVGGGTQYDEDTAHVSGDKLTMAGVVRADTAASLAGTDGDRTALIADASGRLHVNVGTSALPTGASTSANQTTIIGHLDGVETTLGTIDTDTGNISTKIDTLAGAVSGTEMQVDVLTMPTTTVQATDLDIRNLTATDVVTANLSATDNAVLDTIDAVLDTIKVDTEAIETAVEAIQAAQLPDGHNVTVDNASIAVTGTFWQATQPVSGTVSVTGVATASNQSTMITALQLIDDAVQTEDAAHSSGHKGMMMLGVRKDTATALAGTDGDYIPPIMDANGAMHVNLATKLDSTNDSIAVHAVTSGGATPYKLNSAASTNATSVKGSAGQLYNIVCMNTNADERYLKLYNKASAPTVGTDTPVQTYTIPGNAAGGGFAISFPVGLELSTGIAFALTTGAADSDTAAVAANEILVNLTYQ